MCPLAYQFLLLFQLLSIYYQQNQHMEKLLPLFNHGGDHHASHQPLCAVPISYASNVAKMQVHSHSILLRKDGMPTLHLPLSFDLTFEIVRSKTIMMDKQSCVGSKQIGVAEGIVFEQNEKKVQFAGSHESLTELRNCLATKINQVGFHQLIKPIKKLGKGNFGTVYLVQRYEDGKIFAAKSFLKYTTYGNENGKQSLLNQIRIMRFLNHPHLLNVYEVYETQNSIYVLVQQLKGGSLGDHIGSLRVFQTNEAKLIMKGILEGLAYMHSRNIMHRDIKPDNIMFRHQGLPQTVLADFGLATECDIEEYLFYRCGTPGYVAPEVINLVDKKEKYSPVCDIYSVGCIFFQILTGKRLFDARNQNDMLRLNKAAFIDFKMSVFLEMDPLALDLLKKMLEKDPTNRISAHHALATEYFKDMTPFQPEKVSYLHANLSSQDQKSYKQPQPEVVIKKPIRSPKRKSRIVAEQKKEDKLNDSIGEFVVRDKEKKLSKRFNQVIVAAASFADRLKEDNQARRKERRERGEGSEKSESSVKEHLQKPKPPVQLNIQKQITEIDEPQPSPTIRKHSRSVKFGIKKEQGLLGISPVPTEINPEQGFEVKLLLKSEHENIVVECDESSEYEIVIRSKRKVKAHVL